MLLYGISYEKSSLIPLRFALDHHFLLIVYISIFCSEKPVYRDIPGCILEEVLYKCN